MSPAPRAKRRLWVPSFVEQHVILEPDAVNYLQRVLRLNSGDTVEIFDGNGGFAQARLLDDGAALEILTRDLEPPPRCMVTLAVAVPKGERADWLVEKCTEAGVSAIQWIIFERSLEKRSSQKIERWERMARAAAGQCGRARVPVIHAPTNLLTYVSTLPEDGGRYVALAEGEHRISPAREAKAVLMVGPEGGLTAEEKQMLDEAKFAMVSLGPWVLRTETAAVIGVSALGW